MRKLSLVLTVLFLAAVLGGCGGSDTPKEPVSPSLRVPALEGEPLQPDTTGLKEYSLDNGIRFHAVKGLDETEVDGMAAYLRNTFFLVMVIQEPRTGTVLEGVDLAGYGELLASQNGLAPSSRTATAPSPPPIPPWLTGPTIFSSIMSPSTRPPTASGWSRSPVMTIWHSPIWTIWPCGPPASDSRERNDHFLEENRRMGDLHINDGKIL